MDIRTNDRRSLQSISMWKDSEIGISMPETKEEDEEDKNSVHLLRRTKRWAGLHFLIEQVISIGSKVLGVALTMENNRMTRELIKKNFEKVFKALDRNYDAINKNYLANFEKVFKALDRNYDAINKNYLAIKDIDKKVDRNFVALTLVYELASETLLAVEQTRAEMNHGFTLVLDSIRNSRIEPTVSKLNNFIQYFSSERERFKHLSQMERVAKLQEPGGILFHLKDSRSPNVNSLNTLLLDIINKGYAIPQDANDEIAFYALYALFYGTQTYVSVMFFLLEQYSYLADFYYQNFDIEKYNECFWSLITTFQDFKHSLLGINGHESLIEKVLSVLHIVKQKDLIKNGGNSPRHLSDRIKSLTQVKQIIGGTELPIIMDEPVKITGIEFVKQEISSPLGKWEDGAKVKYGVQYKDNRTCSKVEWSDQITVSGKTNPFLKIPVDPQRRTRLIFRQFNNDRAELVGVLESKYITRFRDINRDLYNAALRPYKDLALKEVNILLQNGADINTSFDKGRRAIHAAAQMGNTHIAHIFLQRSNATIIDIKDNDGYTPMHIAAAGDQEEFIEFLMQQGSDVNVKTNSEGLTPLHIAAYKGYETSIKTLLQNNVTDANARENKGFTPLHSAVFGGVSIVKALMLNDSADVNARSKIGLTPLHLTTINNYLDVAQTLLESDKIDINAKTDGSFTALHFASMFGNLDLVKFLTSKNGTDVNMKSVNGWTPLHFAVALKKDEISSELLNVNSTCVNIEGEGNVTPLHIAATTGQNNVVLGLLHKGAAIHQQTIDGSTALHLAAKYGNEDVLRALIGHGANIEKRTMDGLTTLHSAVSSPSSNIEIIKYLIEKGANLTEVTNSGETFLHLAARSGSLDIARYFIERKINIHAKDSYGNDPLHISAESGHLVVAKYLIENSGASVNAKNNDNQTPLHCGTKSGNLDLIKYFIDNGADIKTKDNNGDTILHTAVISGHLNVIKYLVGLKNTDINATNYKGKAPLHFAAQAGNLNIVRFLVENGCDYNSKDDNGLAPLLFAAKNGHLNVVKYLVEDMSVNVNVVCNFAARVTAAYNGHLDTVKYLSHKENGYLVAINSFVSLLSAAQNGHLEIVKHLVDESFEFKPPVPAALLIYAAKLFIDKQMIHEEHSDLGRIAQLYIMTFKCIFRNFRLADYKIFLSILLSAKNGHITIINYLTEEKSFKYDGGITLLHLAAANGDFYLVRYLTDEKNADFTAEDNQGMTPLLYAAKNNHLQIMKYLVRKGAKLVSSKGRDPLLFGAANGNLDMVKYLMENGSDVNAKINGGWIVNLRNIFTFNNGEESTYYDNTVLCNAARNGHFGTIRYLVGKGADVDSKNDTDNAPLLHAAKNGDFSMVKYLVENGADVNINKNSYFPVYYAIKNGHLDIVKYFVEDKHAYFNIHDNTIGELLEEAVTGGHYAVISYLIEKGAKINDSLLYKAVKVGNVDIVKCLVSHGANVHARTGRNLTNNLISLHFAAESGHLNVVKYLTNEKNVNVNVKDSFNWTPLHYAARGGHLDVVKFLIDEKHADLTGEGSDGETPLSCAVKHPIVFAYIFDKTPCHLILRKHFYMYLMGAVESGRLNIVKYFVEKGADVNNGYSTGFLEPHVPPLLRAMQNNFTEIAEYLIEKGANVNAKVSLGLFSPDNLSPLHIAAADDQLVMAEFLVKKGANVSAETGNAITPLQMAELCCSTRTSNFLKLKNARRNRRNTEFVDLQRSTADYYADNLATSKASKPSSWINIFAVSALSLIKSCFQMIYSPLRAELSSYPYKEPNSRSNKVKHSNIQYTAQFTSEVCASNNINLTLFVLQSILDKKYPLPSCYSFDPKDTLSDTLNIIYTFEQVLRKIAGQFEVSVEDLDFCKLHLAIQNHIRSEKYSQISRTLYLAAKDVFPKGEAIKRALNVNIEEMLSKQLLHNNQYKENINW